MPSRSARIHGSAAALDLDLKSLTPEEMRDHAAHLLVAVVDEEAASMDWGPWGPWAPWW